ncbi:MAG: thymidine kinase [Verrucomicrobiota bacterium]
MAQVYFYYSAMNAGKSTSLLQSSYNYRERGMNTLLLTPAINDRDKLGSIASRIGLQSDAHSFASDEDLYEFAECQHAAIGIACVLIDEAQFLSTEQVEQICEIADNLNIPVLCYGLRTDFQGTLFEGSAALLAWADKLIELKTICHCGKKATMNLRTTPEGKPIHVGEQIEIGGNERYIAMCRKHFHQALLNPDQSV